MGMTPEGNYTNPFCQSNFHKRFMSKCRKLPSYCSFSPNHVGREGNCVDLLWPSIAYCTLFLIKTFFNKYHLRSSKSRYNLGFYCVDRKRLLSQVIQSKKLIILKILVSSAYTLTLILKTINKKNVTYTVWSSEENSEQKCDTILFILFKTEAKILILQLIQAYRNRHKNSKPLSLPIYDGNTRTALGNFVVRIFTVG